MFRIITEYFVALFQNVGSLEESARLLRYVDPTRLSQGFHFVGEGNVVAPHVKFEPASPYDPAQHCSCMDPNSHVNSLAAFPVEFLHCVNHT